MSPANRVATCDGEIQIANDSEYLLVNRIKIQNFMWGRLNELGVLVFWMDNRPKDGQGCPGWWMFDQMMDFFAPNVIAIKGNWTYGDNLAKINELTGAGIPLESAATQATTGRYAANHGYQKVSLIAATGFAGAYQSVQVLFEKH